MIKTQRLRRTCKDIIKRVTILINGFIDRLIRKVSGALALASGFVLLLMAISTLVSVVGLKLNVSNLWIIRGNFELVEVGTAVAVFGFLPHCHLNRGHVTVDVLVSMFPSWAFNLLTLLGDMLIAIISGVLAWRLWLGFQDKLAYGDTTMILGAPLWYGYALCFGAAVWGTIVAIYVIGNDARQIVRRGQVS